MNEFVKPLQDRVVVKRIEDEELKNGLYVVKNPLEKSTRAEVLAVGTGRISDDGLYATPMTVKVGDIVLLGKYGGTEVNFMGQDLVIMREEEILAVLDDKDV